LSCRDERSDNISGASAGTEQTQSPAGQTPSVVASVRLTVDQFAPQDWQAPDYLNTFVLKSLSGNVVTGIAFTDADTLPTLGPQHEGPLIDEEFTAAHDFLAVFRLPWTSIGKENPQQVLDTLIVGKGLGGVYSASFSGNPVFRVDKWVEGESLNGGFRIPFPGVVASDAGYPPRDWMLSLANEGQISLDFEGPYREWAGQSDTCFSPTQNVDSATSALGFGCACQPLVDVEARCVTANYDDDPTSGYVFFMYCDPEMAQWEWGNDGPCGI
jgi:hypothetical protein